MSRTRTKRYLGMTIPQLGSLGILFLCIGCLFIGGYWWLNSMVAAAYEVPESNFTPAPLATPLPSETPPPTPSPTPITYESLIPAGWKQFKSDAAPGMEIWFPPSYVAWSESLNLKSVEIFTSGSLENLDSVLKLVDMTQSAYLLYTTFGMISQPLPVADLDKTIDLVYGDLIRDARLMERSDFVVGDYPARRVVFDITGNGVNAGLVVYLVQENGTVWHMGFATPYNELFTRMPDFDRSVQTFRIVTP